MCTLCRCREVADREGDFGQLVLLLVAGVGKVGPLSCHWAPGRHPGGPISSSSPPSPWMLKWSSSSSSPSPSTSSSLSLGQSRPMAGKAWRVAHFAPPALSSVGGSDDFSWQTYSYSYIIIYISSYLSPSAPFVYIFWTVSAVRSCHQASEFC